MNVFCEVEHSGVRGSEYGDRVWNIFIPSELRTPNAKSHLVEKRYTVVEVYVSPGFSVAVG